MMDGEGVWKFADQLHRELLALAQGEAVKPRKRPEDFVEETDEEIDAAMSRTIARHQAELVGRPERIAALKAAEFGGDDQVATAIAKCASMIAFNADYDLEHAAERLRGDAIRKCSECVRVTFDEIHRTSVADDVTAEHVVDSLKADGFVMAMEHAGLFRACAQHGVAS